MSSVLILFGKKNETFLYEYLINLFCFYISMENACQSIHYFIYFAIFNRKINIKLKKMNY